MKGLKALAASVLVLLAMAPAVARNVGPRLSAMGGVGIAVIDDGQNYPNPASVYFYGGEYSFALGGIISDTVGVASWPYVPSTTLNGAFTGERMALDFSVAFESQNPRESGNVDIYQTTTIDVNMSAGYGSVALGLGISGGSVRQRLDCAMGHPGDYIMQDFFSQYDRVVNSEFLQVRTGFLFSNNNLSVGVLFDNILDKDGAKTTLNWGSLFEHTGIGAYWTRDEYSNRGQMNHLVYSFALEIDNLFRNRTRCLNAGAELKFRFVRNFSISARAGFSGGFRNMDEGTWTLGLGMDVKNLRVSMIANLPLSSPASLSLSGMLQF